MRIASSNKSALDALPYSTSIVPCEPRDARSGKPPIRSFWGALLVGPLPCAARTAQGRLSAYGRPTAGSRTGHDESGRDAPTDASPVPSHHQRIGKARPGAAFQGGRELGAPCGRGTRLATSPNVS